MSREHALTIFDAAIAAVLPEELIRQNVRFNNSNLVIGDAHLNLVDESRVFVVGAGKASPAMAAEMENILGERIDAGLVITKYDHGIELQRCTVREAGHPVPDLNGINATCEILELTRGLKESDVVVFLLSGGASSLLCDFPDGSSLEEIQKLSIDLLNSGATIHEINCVRKHVSLVKGGQLARHFFPAFVVTLIISDVIGDDLSTIGSGPTSPDQSTFHDSLHVLDKYGLFDSLSASLKQWIKKGLNGEVNETPKPGDPVFDRVRNLIIGSNDIALAAAAREAESLGYSVTQVSSTMSGETAAVAAGIVDETVKYAGPKPACLLWGGETTIKITGEGTGGRNQHSALSAIMHMRDNLSYADDFPVILFAGTDGTDGPTEATGAVVDKQTLITMEMGAIDLDTFYHRQDSYHFFQLAGGQIITGPTGTNVMDLVIALIP